MDSSDRMYAIVWGFISAALVAVVFLISSCQINNNKIDADLQAQCLQRGGQMVLVTEADSRNGTTCRTK